MGLIDNKNVDSIWKPRSQRDKYKLFIIPSAIVRHVRESQPSQYVREETGHWFKSPRKGCKYKYVQILSRKGLLNTIFES